MDAVKLVPIFAATRIVVNVEKIPWNTEVSECVHVNYQMHIQPFLEW
jgi:hypothetical protein